MAKIDILLRNFLTQVSVTNKQWQNHFIYYVFILAMHPYRLDVFEDSVIVTLNDKSVIVLNKFNGSHSKTLLTGYTRSSDILILHPLKQVNNGKYL